MQKKGREVVILRMNLSPLISEELVGRVGEDDRNSGQAFN
jgi:hypothetical protein